MASLLQQITTLIELTNAVETSEAGGTETGTAVTGTVVTRNRHNWT